MDKFKKNTIIRCLLLTFIALYIIPEIACYKQNKLYEVYSIKCWEIAIKKYKGKKQIAKVYTDEYYKLANVLEKCNRCKAKYYVNVNH